MAAPIENKENKTTVIPRNWKTMFGNKNDNDINNMFLTIEAWSPPVINAITTDLTNIYNFKASERIEGFKFFYPRDNIQESIKHTYSESSSTYSEALAGFRGAVTKNLTAVVEASQGTTGGALTEEPHIFNKSERRTFSINIPLIAYDDLDKDIYAAIRFFRKNSYPRRATDSKLKALLNTVEYPSVFKIRGGLFDTNQPAKGSTFILEDCNIDYNANAKKFINGLPIEATLTLGFTELNLLFGEDFDDTPMNVNISTAPARGYVRETTFASTGYRPLPHIEEMTKPSKNEVTNVSPSVDTLDKTLLGNVTDYVKKSKLAKKITNLPDTIEDRLKQEAADAVKNSDLYKKVTALTDNDPIHLLEVRAILGKIRGL